MPARRRRVLAALTAAPLTLTGLVVAAPSATAASPDVVIAEAYGGGGNSGAPLRSDFVELANRSQADVDLTGWTLRYYSANGTTAQTTQLSGSVVAGGRFLVKQNDGANTAATPLPAPDATGTVSMSSSGARVEVVRPDGQLADRLGWGGATPSEGASADGTNNSTSVARKDLCVDTDNNAADFAVGAPTPQNSSTATPVVCAPDDGGEPPVDEPETIAQIQGTHHISPLDGTAVSDVEGVVTAVSRNGFWMQSTTMDDDDATSEGVLVYTRSAPSVAVGDTVTVDGFVDEFRPGGSGGWDNLTTTEIVSPVVTRTGTAAVPAPVVLGEDRTAPQQTIDADDPKSVEYADAAFRPERDAIDFYESLEGMQVGVRDAQVVGPTGYEIPVVPGSGVDATRSSAGGVVYSGYDRPNAMRVLVDDVLLPSGSLPDADVRDTLPGLVAGPLDYSFANFKLLATEVPTVTDGGLEREVTQPQHDRELSVAAFNVENLAPSNPQSKFDRLAGQIVTNLRSPDILAVEEVQDASGPTDDGTVDSTATTDQLIAAIQAQGGPTYEANWVNPQDKTDGGQPGGNIRNVLLHRTDRDIDFTERSSGAADHATSVATDRKGALLTESPGRIAPSSPAFDDSRKPLIGEYRYRGERVFVAAVHFSSKGGDDPLFGRWQQPVRSSEDARHAQAREVRSIADDLLAADPEAKFVVAGDVNDFEFSQTADILADVVEGSGSTAMTDLPRTLPQSERWTYVYEGNSQVLDHIFVSPSLATLDGEVGGPWRPGKG
ncbi:MAG: lamin tail domain-containing protein, partial [Janibacter sp.]|nr:lamin tail domain-containing protein [Janibacter sp.]